MDWPPLITGLQRRGLSISQIAKACGAGQATISDLKTARVRDPSFTLGQRLVALSKASDRQLQRMLAEATPEPTSEGATHG